MLSFCTIKYQSQRNTKCWSTLLSLPTIVVDSKLLRSHLSCIMYTSKLLHSKCLLHIHECIIIDIHCLSDTHCAGLRTCEMCQNSPACGWCDDGTNTGLGQCVEGGLPGPLPNTNICSKQHWYFKTCPGICQSVPLLFYSMCVCVCVCVWINIMATHGL